MRDWGLVLFWLGALAVGGLTWFFLFAWFGLHGIVLALALLALSAVAGTALNLGRQPHSRRAHDAYRIR